MKKVRECFHMLITAVICLMVSMVPGKNVTACRLPSKTAICAMFGGQCVT